MRLLTNSVGNVRGGASYTPFGEVMGSTAGSASAGSAKRLGFAGEQTDATGLQYLRARYYAPEMGRFLTVDPFAGRQAVPYSLHPYQYGYSNPVRYVDPSGLCAEHGDEVCWGVYEQLVGKYPGEYSYRAIMRVTSLQEHIIAAAQRHGFIPQDACSANEGQEQLLYALGAIIYRESFGSDQEAWEPQAWGNRLGMNTTNGIAQMRPNTVAELEKADLIYDVGTSDNPATTKKKADLSEDRGHIDRVNDLMNPLWAIEFAAGNMENARNQLDFNIDLEKGKIPQHPTQNKDMTEWEQMASWYNRGIINSELVEAEEREDFRINEQAPYIDGTWAAMQAIESLDLLGLSEKCESICRP